MTWTSRSTKPSFKTSYAELDHLATVIWSSSRSRIFWSFFDSVLVAKSRALEGVKLYSRDPGNAHHFWANFWAPALNLKRHQKCKQNHQISRGHAHKICLISGPGQTTVAFWSVLCIRVINIALRREYSSHNLFVVLIRVAVLAEIWIRVLDVFN